MQAQTLTHTVHGWTDDIQIVVRRHQGNVVISWTPRKNSEGGGVEFLNDHMGYHPLQRGLPLKRGARNVFRQALGQITTSAFGWEDRGGPLFYRLKSLELRRLFQFMTTSQDEFLAELDQQKMKVSRRFPSFRWQIFSLLKKHPSTRLEQLTETCPGLLAALGASRRRLLTTDDVSKLARLVVEGHALDPILDLLFERLMNSPASDQFENPWLAVAVKDPQSVARIHRNWKWIVRHAQTASGPGYMCWPAPAFLPMSDAPKGNREFARWNARLQGSRFLWDTERYGLTQPQIKSLSNLVSKHPEFPKLFRGNNKTGLIEIVKKGRVPGAKTDILALAAEARKMARWKKDAGKREREAYEKVYQAMPASERLIEMDWSYRTSEISMRTLVTKGDLISEGLALKNCLANLGPNLREGHKIFLRADIGAEGYALELNRCLNGWYITDLRGVDNAQASDQARALVADTLRENFPGIVPNS